MSVDEEGFYEDDEPIEKVIEAFEMRHTWHTHQETDDE